MISKIINDIVKYCFFIRKAFTHKLKPGLILILVLQALSLLLPAVWEAANNLPALRPQHAPLSVCFTDIPYGRKELLGRVAPTLFMISVQLNLDQLNGRGYTIDNADWSTTLGLRANYSDITVTHNAYETVQYSLICCAIVPIAHYESLQDKLAQLKDARDALNVLRDEHREKRRREQEELERLRQIQMAQKLEVLRQKKQV